MLIFCYDYGIATVEQSPTQEVQHPKYDADYTARLIVYSFFFSQGNAGFQYEILGYLVSKFRTHFDESVFDEASSLAAQRIKRIGSNRKTHKELDWKNEPIDFSEAAAQLQAKTYFGYVKELLDEEPEVANGKFELPKLRKHVLEKDYQHLGPTNNGGGRRREPSASSSPYSDGHLSQWVYFGLMRQATGMSEYDQMFADMVSCDMHYKEYELPHLINYHIHFHPDQYDFLPDWAKESVVPGSTPY